jgi:L-threonylcarbamoyladenylate synthase
MATPFQLRYAASIIHRGGVIAYPTEAVYGLGCNPLNADAVQKILHLKQRDWRKGLILIASDMSQLTPYVQPLSPDLKAKVEATWPGPVTWLLPARLEVPKWIKGLHQTIAVRVTAHQQTAQLCRTAKMAIISTSANVADKPPAKNPLKLLTELGEGIDYILHGELGGSDKPSQIKDGMTDQIIRSS